ncbi:hypothetical protein [Acidiphilium sp.]|uniref:hypothetical protein n=1 Tax=Acidiphilium sp. TaxID=527 RepID=UPI003D00E46F
MRGQSQSEMYGWIRILFGVVWLFNTALQANWAYASHFAGSFSADWVKGQPIWIRTYGHWAAHIVGVIGPVTVAHATVGLDGLLALSLLSGIGLSILGWVGIIYNLWLWSTVGGFGGPYVRGATDPGTAIVYALCFFFVVGTRSWQSISLKKFPQDPVNERSLWVGQIIFGLLWAFDAFWKWHPYFLHHPVSYLRSALPGEPEWIKTYINVWIVLIDYVGPLKFGIFAAIAETAIAISLLFDTALVWMIPFGVLYSIGIWTTAEGWGAPYSPGVTANKGDVLGTTNIYAIIFLFIAVRFFYRSKKKTTA